MSLSLPPIVHSSMKKHMGPEPSYVIDGSNGVLFERESSSSLEGAIVKMIDDRVHLNRMQRNAFVRYEELTTPSLGARILRVINSISGGINENS